MSIYLLSGSFGYTHNQTHYYLFTQLYLAVFSEFLEGICRIGVLKYGSLHEDVESEQQEKLSHYECIKLAITATCAVVKE